MLQNLKNKLEKSKVISEALFVLLVIVIAALLCFAANIANQHENRLLSEREISLFTKVKQLEAEQTKLVATKEALKSDPMFVEYYLRKKCRLRRPGEVIYTEEGRR